MLKEISRALKMLALIRAVYAGIIRLKCGQVGESVAFSGVRLKVDGIVVEIKGVITRIE